MIKLSKYVGLPYKNKGRGFDGVDCYGLFVLIYKEELGIDLPDFTEVCYNLEWYKLKQNHIMNNIGKFDSVVIEVKPPYVLFDGILFYHKNYKVANHLGIYIGSERFMHVLESKGSVVSELDRFWTPRVYSALRYVGDKHGISSV